MFFIGFHLFLYYLFFIEYYYTFPYFMGVEAPLALIHGPMLLFYIFSLIKPQFRFEGYFWIHLLPLLVFYVLLIPDGFAVSKEELLTFAFETIPNNPPLYWTIREVMINLSGPIYVIWSLWVLRRHQTNIENNFSYTEKIDLGWLKKLIAGMVLIWVVVIITDNSNYVFTAVTVFVFIIGYFGFRQGEIFTDNSIIMDESESKDKKDKYEKSSLTEIKSKEHMSALELLMIEQKPFLESKITLKEVSERMEIHPNHLSQVINENLQQNFYDFINGYRVEEFKKKLSEDSEKRFTLLAHAYDSGFSSKSSFNEVFKKTTGLTPSEYQKQLSS